MAVWNVPMSDKMYKIEFEHGTTTGKRVIRVNGRVNFEEIGKYNLIFRRLYVTIGCLNWWDANVLKLKGRGASFQSTPLEFLRMSIGRLLEI